MRQTHEPTAQIYGSTLVPLASADTRTQILMAGLRAFIRLGYGGATISEIAKEARMSKPRVIYHFANPDVILEALAQMWGDLGRSVTIEHLANLPTESLNDRVVAMSNAMFLWMKKHPDFAKLTPILLHAGNHNPRIAEMQRISFDTGKARLAEFLSKRAKPKLPLARLKDHAQSIHLMMIGACLYVVGINCWEDLDKIAALTEQSIRNLINSEK